MAETKSKSKKPKGSLWKTLWGTGRYTEKYVMGPMDLAFCSIVLILLVIGIIMMFSAGYAWAIRKQGSGTYYVGRQLGYSAAGLLFMFLISFVDYHELRRPIIAYGLYLVQLVLLILVKWSPFGVLRSGAKRWLKLPFLPEFQPSEITKLAIILIFAYLISTNYSKLEKFSYGVVPFAVLLALPVFLILTQTHLSATIIICAVAGVMMFVGGISKKHLLLICLCGAAFISLFVLYKVNVDGIGYFMDRINVWRDPFSTSSQEDPSLWQTQNSLIAIGSGGLFGLGLGNSRQKFLYLPESQNDFVFAVICEELGFCGAVLVLLIFIMFVLRGFYIATKAPDKFGMMLVVGLTFQIGIQALLNIAVVTNAIPNTGISLPFFSYGGTALIMQLAQMGVILNVSRQCVFSEPKQEIVNQTVKE